MFCRYLMKKYSVTVTPAKAGVHTNDNFVFSQQGLIISLLLILLLTGISEAVDQPLGGTKKATKKTELLLPLLREGFPVIDRKAKLVRHPKDNRWFLVFEPFITDSSAKDNKESDSDNPARQGDLIKRAASVKQKSAGRSVSPPEAQVKDLLRGDELFTWPMEVLPGKWLTAMTRVTGNKVDLSITFRVWGEVTVYRDRNFILPNLVATDKLFGQSVSGLSDLKGKKAVGGLERPFGGVSGKKSSDTNVKQIKEKLRMSEKLRKMLLTVPRTHVLALPEETRDRKQSRGQVKESGTGSSSGISIGRGNRGKWKDGSLIVDRVGRLIFDLQGGRFQFTFEADGTALAEPPIIIHPNLLLEEMEKSTGMNIKYRITGQVSKYRDKHYILMRKVLIRHGTGNLGK